MFFLSPFTPVIISLSIWKEAWRIASSWVLWVSTTEGPEENKEPTANLIIISHLFKELMWCLRCQTALFLSICSHPFLAYPHHFSVCLSTALFFSSFLFSRLCGLTWEALIKKSFQGRMRWPEMSFPDQMLLKRGPSYHSVRSTSLVLCSVLRQLSSPQSLNEITCGFLVFLPLMFYKINYTVRREGDGAILQTNKGISLILASILLIVQEFSRGFISK